MRGEDMLNQSAEEKRLRRLESKRKSNRKWKAKNPDYNKNWLAKNPDYMKVWRKENRTGSFEKKIKELLTTAKGRAKRNGVEFSITYKDLMEVSHCPLLGILLDFSINGRGGKPNSPSIDRIDPTKGYVPGNVWIISAKANRMKSDATLEELETLVANFRKAMENNHA